MVWSVKHCTWFWVELKECEGVSVVCTQMCVVRVVSKKWEKRREKIISSEKRHEAQVKRKGEKEGVEERRAIFGVKRVSLIWV